MLDPLEEGEPIGVLCFANCNCGSTLALRYEDTREHVAFNQAMQALALQSGREDIDVVTDLVELVHRWVREGAVLPPLATPPPSLDPLVLEIGAALLEAFRKGSVAIPPAPTAALKVRSLVLSDDVNVRAVADALAIDPGLATGVLRVANSAYFQRSGEVSSLVQAVTRLGFKEIAQLSLALGVGRAFTGNGLFSQERAKLWRKSLVTALLGKTLAHARRLDGENCFVAGLFSSLGAVVGLLSLEELIKSRSNLPAQSWTWWMRLVELFAADLGREAAARWELPSLIAAVAAQPHASSSSSSSNHSGLVDAIAVARIVAERTLDRPRVERTDLEDLAGLSADERAVLVNAIPTLAQAIAAFDAALQRPSTAPPSSSSVPDPVPPPATPLSASTVVPDAGRFDVVGLVSEALVLEGPQSFAPTTLVAVELEVEPRLRLWATVTHAFMAPTGHRTRLAPFAVDDHAWRQWRLLATDHAAERTRATLRDMAGPRKPR